LVVEYESCQGLKVVADLVLPVFFCRQKQKIELVATDKKNILISSFLIFSAKCYLQNERY
jgi:hypothetical protein